ncbi:MAG: hypothetical protein JWO47_435 [Candidatus Saccharibacteria bacterium]|nr:hypothetical protein [Candidatus Saccharibacteria bacterium]
MDMVSHPGQQSAAPTPVQQQAAGKGPAKKSKLYKGEGLRILNVVLLILVALIIGLIALYVALSNNSGETKYVDKTKFQAIFLNGGQVYFGKVHAMNEKYITLDNIYYLRVNQQVQPNQSTASTANQDVSLAKLGCELHGPTDVMVINREQVLFWENLKASGQVTKAITAYVKANPQGQSCDTASGTGTGTGSSTGTGTTTTPTVTK